MGTINSLKVKEAVLDCQYICQAVNYVHPMLSYNCISFYLCERFSNSIACEIDCCMSKDVS